MALQALLLSTDESLEYVEDHLSISNAKTKLISDPKNLLNAIVCSFQELVPIQTITLHAIPPTKRRRPCWNDVKNCVTSGIGGLCYELNIFMFALLKGLGYDVYLAESSVSRPSNHVVTIAQHVCHPGDVFLVDAGCGFPTFQAVDLNFLEESQVYQQSFLRYKFVKKDDTILRMHQSRDIRRKALTLDSNWKRYYDFQLKPLTVDEINERFDKVFEDTSSTTSHSVLRCTVFPGQQACALRNTVILRENENHILEANEFESDIDLTDAICTTFLPFAAKRSVVMQAIRGWRNCVE